MKHLKKFNLFEAVITPNKIEDSRKVSTYDDFIKYGEDNGFDVVVYDDFYNSLGEADKKTAPPKGVPFFALFHPINKRPMFVFRDQNSARMPGMKEIVDDIIGHEKVHGEQNVRRKGLTFNLPDPTKRKEYFSDKDEIMAFSWSIANGLSKKNKTVQDAFKDLDRNKWGREEHFNLWSTIKGACDERVLNRYRKYIYMYLDKMLNDETVVTATEDSKEEIIPSGIDAEIKKYGELFNVAIQNKEVDKANKYNSILKDLISKKRNQ